MTPETRSLISSYDEKYRHENYFRDRTWLYRPFIKALIKKVGLNVGSTILDAGCGQGFFTWLFARAGLKATGVDLSIEGIKRATNKYGMCGISFEVGDVLTLPSHGTYDCVFVRSCSLYNTEAFRFDRRPTDKLLSYVKPGGTFIFDYYTNFSSRKSTPTWRFHSLPSVVEHFSCYTAVEVYFSSRIDAMALGRFVFSKSMTAINSGFSRRLAIGGEAIALVRKL